MIKTIYGMGKLKNWSHYEMPGHVTSYLHDFSIITKTRNVFSRNPPVDSPPPPPPPPLTPPPIYNKKKKKIKKIFFYKYKKKK